MLNNDKKSNGEIEMKDLIISAIKGNYFIATALLYKSLDNPEILFSQADKIHTTLNSIVNSNYKNIYIVAIRLKEDYVDEIKECIKQILEKQKNIKWYVLEDRIHLKEKADKLFFNSILKIAQANQTIIDAMKTDNDLKISENDYNNFNNLYKFIVLREKEKMEMIRQKTKNKDKQMRKLSEGEKEFENKYNYIEYSTQKFFRSAMEDVDALKDMIKKIAYDKLNENDIKNAYNFSYFDRHLSGQSKEIKEVVNKIKKLRKNPDVSILIYGETGVGKEIAAQLIHRESKRTGMLLSLNCSAIPDTLMESILFGYEKGSHSTAIEQKEGILEKADGGTVFLDEIGEMPLQLQAKLLRVLETREVSRIGGEGAPKKVDFRLISATNKNLKDLVNEGKFREDLYYRVVGYEIEIPPLRKRKDDILYIANEILYNMYVQGKCERIILTKKQIDDLKSYDWPGNVRELQCFLERAAIDDDFDFKKRIQDYKLAELTQKIAVSEVRKLVDVEKEEIIKALKVFDGNKTQAADALGIAVNTLKAKMKSYGIK